MTDQHASLSLSTEEQLKVFHVTKPRSLYTRYFFIGMAVMFILVTASGFGPEYAMFLGNSIPGYTFEIHWFTHVHGAVMTTWLLLFLTQTILVVTNNVKFHRRLGMASLTFGIIVWINIIIVNFRVRLSWLPPVEDGAWVIFFMGVLSAIMFALFYTWGMMSRRNLATHKRLMLFAVLCLMQASVDRLRFLPWMNEEFFSRFIYLDLLLIPIFIYDLMIQKRIHKITWVGSAVIILSQVILQYSLGNNSMNRAAFNLLEPFAEKPVEVKLTSAQTESILGHYAGQDYNFNIVRNGEHLEIQNVNGPTVEIAATAENEFFIRTVAWKLSFVNGPDGKAAKIIIHEPSVRWEMSRVKDK